MSSLSLSSIKHFRLAATVCSYEILIWKNRKWLVCLRVTFNSVTLSLIKEWTLLSRSALGSRFWSLSRLAVSHCISPLICRIGQLTGWLDFLLTAEYSEISKSHRNTVSLHSSDPDTAYQQKQLAWRISCFIQYRKMGKNTATI